MEERRRVEGEEMVVGRGDGSRQQELPEPLPPTLPILPTLPHNTPKPTRINT
jgi:hypothetical protein